MSVEDDDDLACLKRIGSIVASVRDAVGGAVRSGVSTLELDRFAAELLADSGARSAPQLAYGFPGATCISVNDELAHGIPSAGKVLATGDIVNIDVSAELDGYWADTGASFAVGDVPPVSRRLLETTRQALDAGLSAVRSGAPIRNIGRAVQTCVGASPFRLVRNLCGHGVGRFIHEEPSIPNSFQQNLRGRLTDGLVITIEPFLTTGATMAVQADDGWTLRTPDGSIGAQFEHTVVVTRSGPLILTEAA